jgi:hypothetical protein
VSEHERRRLSKPERLALGARRAEAWVAEWLGGFAVPEIAARYGVTDGAVHEALRQASPIRERRRNAGVVEARDGGFVLREARTATGMTQIGLDRAVGVSRGTTCRLEGTQGHRVSRATAARIASALGREADDLFVPCSAESRSRYDRKARTCEPMPGVDRAFAVVAAWREAAEACREYRQQSGLLLRREAAAFLRISVSLFDYYVEAGLISPAEHFQYPGRRGAALRRFRAQTRGTWATGDRARGRSSGRDSRGSRLCLSMGSGTVEQPRHRGCPAETCKRTPQTVGLVANRNQPRGRAAPAVA